MLISNEPPPKYEDVKRRFFDRYGRKIEAIISNIDSNSLHDEDKAALKCKLAKQLIESI